LSGGCLWHRFPKIFRWLQLALIPNSTRQKPVVFAATSPEVANIENLSPFAGWSENKLERGTSSENSEKLHGVSIHTN
jgi:hypothetical protein